MKEKMPKKSGRWWFWRKRADSTIKQVRLPVFSPFIITVLEMDHCKNTKTVSFEFTN